MPHLSIRIPKPLVDDINALTKAANAKARFTWDRRTASDIARTALAIGLQELLAKQPKPRTQKPKARR
jgi:hypothetical protein